VPLVVFSRASGGIRFVAFR